MEKSCVRILSKERGETDERGREREREGGWKGIMFEAIIGDYAYLLAHYGSLKGPDRDYYVRRTSSSGSPRQDRPPRRNIIFDKHEDSRRASTEN